MVIRMPRKPNYDREDLITRARDLFWARGWAGTSLKDLEACLDMKPGSFYAAFGSKDALFELAMKKYSHDSLARIDKLVAELGAFGALQALPLAIVSTPATPAKACMLSKTLLELQAHNHPLAGLADEYLTKMEARFGELFAQAQAMGQISPAQSPQKLAVRYQSDLLGLRVTAERAGADAIGIADQISQGLTRL